MPRIEEALEFIKSSDAKWIDLQFVDMNGQLKHKTISSKGIGEELFNTGVETQLEDIYGFAGRALSLIPDSDSFARIPWEPNSIRLISNIYSMPERERFNKDSRYSIERVNINAKAMGISDVQIGSEAEFYIFDNVTADKLSPERGPNFLIDTREAFWNPSPFFGTKNGTYICQPHDTLYAARIQISEIMEEQFRYPIAFHAHGRSANAQQKLKIKEMNAKMAADALITLKYTAKSIAFIANNLATFMPLPIMGDKGNSLKITQKLKKNVGNLFYDKDDNYAQLSQTALYYIGGLLEHAEALCVFTAPTTNSYKKLKMDPRYMTWSRSSSHALVQVDSATNDEERVVTYAGADSSVNPYLAYAAVVAAGLDGIKNKIDPGKPVDDNLNNLNSRKMKELKIKPLPVSIIDAISALESDNKFLKGFIAPELLADYLEQKIAEHNENEKRPTAFEIERYFNR